MIDYIQAIASFLANDALTLEEVVKQLGTITQNYGWNVWLKPKSAFFKEINVVLKTDAVTQKPSKSPSHIELIPAAPLTLVELARVFGNYTEIPAEEKIPPQVIFYLDTRGKPYTIALIAEVSDDHVTKITLRRDRR